MTISTSPSVILQWCVPIHSAWMAHTPGQSISDYRTSFQLQSHHVSHTSHKDTDNTMQPKQPLLMDILDEPYPQSSSHADCDILQQLQDSATKDDLLENSQGSQDNISQPPETPEPEPRSSDTLSLSPTSLLDSPTHLLQAPRYQQKNCGPPQPPKTAGQALLPPPVRAFRPLPQRQGPNPPQWYVPGPSILAATFTNVYRTSGNPVCL